MTIAQLINETGWSVLTNVDLNKEIDGVFCGDILSYVIKNSSPNQIWITTQNHLNVLAVAMLCQFSLIIIAGDVVVDDEIVRLANEKQLPLIKLRLSTYEVSKTLANLGL